MPDTLAIFGGRPAVRRPLEPFNSIGGHERAAVLNFLDKGAPLSGFHGSPRPTFFGGDEVRAFEADWCRNLACGTRFPSTPPRRR